MKLGELAGQLWFYRAKGMLYLEAGRQWILPIMGASAASKYLGFSLTQSIVFWVSLAVVAETSAVLIGYLERRSGATRANYDLARVTDPFKVESLQFAKRTAEDIRLVRLALAAIYRLFRERKN